MGDQDKGEDARGTLHHLKPEHGSRRLLEPLFHDVDLRDRQQLRYPDDEPREDERLGKVSGDECDQDEAEDFREVDEEDPVQVVLLPDDSGKPDDDRGGDDDEADRVHDLHQSSLLKR